MFHVRKSYAELYDELTHSLDSKIEETRQKYDLPEVETRVEVFLPEMSGSRGCAENHKVFLGLVPLVSSSVSKIPKKIEDYSEKVQWLWDYRGLSEKKLLGTSEKLDDTKWYNAQSLLSVGYTNKCGQDSVRKRKKLKKVKKWVDKHKEEIEGFDYVYVHEIIHAVYGEKIEDFNEWYEAISVFSKGSHKKPTKEDLVKAVKLDIKVSPINEGIAIGTACKLTGKNEKFLEDEINSSIISHYIKYNSLSELYQKFNVDEEFPDKSPVYKKLRETTEKFYQEPLQANSLFIET